MTHRRRPQATRYQPPPTAQPLLDQKALWMPPTEGYPRVPGPRSYIPQLPLLHWARQPLLPTGPHPPVRPLGPFVPCPGGQPVLSFNAPPPRGVPTPCAGSFGSVEGVSMRPCPPAPGPQYPLPTPSCVPTPQGNDRGGIFDGAGAGNGFFDRPIITVPQDCSGGTMVPQSPSPGARVPFAPSPYADPRIVGGPCPPPMPRPCPPPCPPDQPRPIVPRQPVLPRPPSHTPLPPTHTPRPPVYAPQPPAHTPLPPTFTAQPPTYTPFPVPPQLTLAPPTTVVTPPTVGYQPPFRPVGWGRPPTGYRPPFRPTGWTRPRPIPTLVDMPTSSVRPPQFTRGPMVPGAGRQSCPDPSWTYSAAHGRCIPPALRGMGAYAASSGIFDTPAGCDADGVPYAPSPYSDPKLVRGPCPPPRPVQRPCPPPYGPPIVVQPPQTGPCPPLPLPAPCGPSGPPVVVVPDRGCAGFGGMKVYV